TSWFRKVLELEPAHAEAAERLQHIDDILAEEAADGEEGASWLSHTPEAARWRVAGDLLGGDIGGLEAFVRAARIKAGSRARNVGVGGQAAGARSTRRQLYGLQAERRVGELIGVIEEAATIVRDLARRTEKLFGTLDHVGWSAAPLRPARAFPSRAAARDRLIALALDLHSKHGLDAALAWLWPEIPVDERPAALSAL